MITRELLVDAVRFVARAGFGTQVLMQRRVRVGFVTASQLLFALQDAGVIGPPGDRQRRPMLAADEESALVLVDAAISDGRIGLDA